MSVKLVGEMDQHKLSSWARRLELPTNPTYDFEAEPGDQPEYANPVTLNNFVILYSNALTQITDFLGAVNKALREAKDRKRKADRALEDFETKVLRQCPPDKDRYTKTIKLQNAYIAFKAEELGKDSEHRLLIDSVRVLEDEIEDLKDKKNGAKDWVEVLNGQGERIKTYLSFVKAEAERVRRGG